MKKIYLLTLASVCGLVSVQAQNGQDAIQQYIDKYKDIAIAEQLRTGVPAAITLAQGIQESGAGRSALSQNANNHFGIKCKLEWAGETYLHTDNAKDECFRKYSSDLDSYRDHSDFLKNRSRYASLFAYDVTDYKAWAHGLKACGYATNPVYAQRLIDLIERYDLNRFSQTVGYLDIFSADGRIDAMASANRYFGLDEDPQDKKKRTNREIRQADNGDVFANDRMANNQPEVKSLYEQKVSPRDYYFLTEKNGIRGFYAPKGALLLDAAQKFDMRYAKLLEINDLADEPLPADMFIYLKKKNRVGSVETHKVQFGENLSMISQDHGITMSELQRLNHLLPGEEPEEGSVLYMQTLAPSKPDLSRRQYNTSRYNQIPDARPVASENESDYVPTRRDFDYTVDPNDPKLKKIQDAEKKKADEKEMQEEVNIANEPAVEEQMAAERLAETAPTASPVSEDEPAEEMSSLDRLKAKLDISVYGERQAPAVERPREDYTTKPASSQEDLKRRIEANQRNQARATPAVEEAPAPASASSNRFHVVGRGDTAFSIAKRYGISVEQLRQWNNLPQNATVNLGARLRVQP